MIISGQICLFAINATDILQNGVGSLCFRDRFDILLYKKLSGGTGLMYTILYGDSRVPGYRCFYGIG